MKLKEEFTYPAGPKAVFDLIKDPAFREKAIVGTGGFDVKVDVKTEGDSVTVTVHRSQPAKVPDFIKSMVGEAVKVKQVEKWGPAEADGSRKASIKMEIVGKPAGMSGHAALTPKGDGASFVVTGDVKVDVMFVGKKIEPFIATVIGKSLRHDVNAGIKHLS